MKAKYWLSNRAFAWSICALLLLYILGVADSFSTESWTTKRSVLSRQRERASECLSKVPSQRGMDSSTTTSLRSTAAEASTAAKRKFFFASVVPQPPRDPPPPLLGKGFESTLGGPQGAASDAPESLMPEHDLAVLAAFPDNVDDEDRQEPIAENVLGRRQESARRDKEKLRLLEQIRQLTTDLEDMTRQQETALEERTYLEHDVDRLEREIPLLQNEVEVAKIDLQVAQRTVSELHTDLAASQQHAEWLGQQLQQEQARNEAFQEELEMLRHNTTVARQTISELQADLAAGQQHAERQTQQLKQERARTESLQEQLLKMEQCNLQQRQDARQDGVAPKSPAMAENGRGIQQRHDADIRRHHDINYLSSLSGSSDNKPQKSYSPFNTKKALGPRTRLTYGHEQPPDTGLDDLQPSPPNEGPTTKRGFAPMGGHQEKLEKASIAVDGEAKPSEEKRLAGDYLSSLATGGADGVKPTATSWAPFSGRVVSNRRAANPIESPAVTHGTAYLDGLVKGSQHSESSKEDGREVANGAHLPSYPEGPSKITVSANSIPSIPLSGSHGDISSAVSSPKVPQNAECDKATGTADGSKSATLNKIVCGSVNPAGMQLKPAYHDPESSPRGRRRSTSSIQPEACSQTINEPNALKVLETKQAAYSSQDPMDVSSADRAREDDTGFGGLASTSYHLHPNPSRSRISEAPAPASPSLATSTSGPPLPWWQRQQLAKQKEC